MPVKNCKSKTRFGNLKLVTKKYKNKMFTTTSHLFRYLNIPS